MRSATEGIRNREVHRGPVSVGSKHGSVLILIGSGRILLLKTPKIYPFTRLFPIKPNSSLSPIHQIHRQNFNLDSQIHLSLSLTPNCVLRTLNQQFRTYKRTYFVCIYLKDSKGIELFFHY
ncbi:hypothetical protein L2E82_47233 [Cichorium intybus]|uniref:Uncharacterized protein n=1 Tax=Cichorium intybus TaxID=13427 RepID=A0ACB8YU68_CICIN|nr:hypothetical protein L2E82_47233 [Cichorium intybus]